MPEPREPKIERSDYQELSHKIGEEVKFLNPKDDVSKESKRMCLDIVDRIEAEHNGGIQYAFMAQIGPTLECYEPVSEQERAIKSEVLRMVKDFQL